MVGRAGIGAVLIALVLGVQGAWAAAPAVKLTSVPNRLESGAVRFVASTDMKAGHGGQPYLELRGINLRQKPRHGYDRPDIVKAGCSSSRCFFDVGRPAGARYAFRAFLVDARTNALVSGSNTIRRSWPRLPLNGLQLLVNGQPRPLEETYESNEDYVPIAPGNLKVEARWQRRAGRSGYTVVVSTTEPAKRELARCKTGTSCVVKKPVRVRLGEEMSLGVTIRYPNGSVIDSFEYCLVGRV